MFVATIRARLPVFGLALALFAGPVLAQNGKLLLTGGVSSIDGAAGGGLTPWALTGSYATTEQLGGTAFATRVKTRDYALNAVGVAAAYHDRLEVSLAHQNFDTGPAGPALGLPGLRLRQDIIGLKVRVFGEAVLDSDMLVPQLAVGLEWKSAHPGGLAATLDSLGARRHGTDVYLSVTKLLLAQGVLINATLRATQANQNGLLGFGGASHDSCSLQPEVSLAWLLNRHVAIGAEYRAKPDNLNPSALGAGLREDDWSDVFIAWAPTKHVSVTLAAVDLGHIVPGVVTRRQRGAYLSVQVAF